MMYAPARTLVPNTDSRVREVSTVAELRRLLYPHRMAERRIAFVPTMGALHDGHLRLVDRARELADLVVMSIFVNPLQFAAGEDFDHYPRDLDSDRRLAGSRDVDVLFTPPVEELYARDRAVEVVARRLATRWEGAARPGHFDGVLTVVAKLFNIVQPGVAVFGQKDIQQAALIRAMVRDLDVPVTIEVAPTVRDDDGLALSSRNRYLSAGERAHALSLPRALAELRHHWSGGERDALRLAAVGERVLASAAVDLEYLALMHPETMEPVAVAAPGTIVAVAARVGSTRLIDNIILGGA